MWKKITSTCGSAISRPVIPIRFASILIKAGGGIPGTHPTAVPEMTLVLEGGFSDADGSYDQGDFLLLRQPSDVHATALQSEDCICLAVLDARTNSPAGSTAG